MHSSDSNHADPSRRRFLLGTASGLALGVPLTLLAGRLGSVLWQGKAAGPAFTGRPKPEGRVGDAFNLRQPEHIVLAGKLGLGRFDRADIWYKLVQL